jgi:hypothetical protein
MNDDFREIYTLEELIEAWGYPGIEEDVQKALQDGSLKMDSFGFITQEDFSEWLDPSQLDEDQEGFLVEFKTRIKEGYRGQAQTFWFELGEALGVDRGLADSLLLDAIMEKE